MHVPKCHLHQNAVLVQYSCITWDGLEREHVIKGLHSECPAACKNHSPLMVSQCRPAHDMCPMMFIHSTCAPRQDVDAFKSSRTLCDSATTLVLGPRKCNHPLAITRWESPLDRLKSTQCRIAHEGHACWPSLASLVTTCTEWHTMQIGPPSWW
jgi:hypothetical protein